MSPVTPLTLSANPSIEELWRQFEIWKAAAEHHDCLDHITSIGRHARNPLLDELLPSILLVRLVSLLDTALRQLVDERVSNGDRRPSRETLHARIDWAVERIPALEAALLHDGRDDRNLIAHEPNGSATWGQLDDRATLVHTALVAIAGLGPRRRYQVRCERSALRSVESPDLIGERDYRFVVFEDDSEVVEFKYTEHLHKLGSAS